MMDTPVVNVGILSEKEILFEFDEAYVHVETGLFMEGEYRALWQSGKLLFNGRLYDELYFEPTAPTASFRLKGVVIGIDFHWERQEDQCFRGALNLVIDDDKLVAINQVGVEEYLTSVISSEMSATASKELLKAHAVISRSWLFAQIEKSRLPASNEAASNACSRRDWELIRWYNRSDHTLFDVCADDHCQRYQGITRASTPIVQEVIDETRGEILMSGSAICDARYSKCCGGATERFETCWDSVPHSYLTTVRDSDEKTLPDLRVESEAGRWFRTSPKAFCNTRDKKILSQVLNNYDQETTNFYRWKVSYTQAELAELISRKIGLDFGEIVEMVPARRGPSGRIEALVIIGTRRRFTLGKELEIRRVLSETHLYSSAFVVDKDGFDDKGIPQHFTLTGAGWGHGVGLCQIGAAIMGERGFNYREILSHYYKGASIEKKY